MRSVLLSRLSQPLRDMGHGLFHREALLRMAADAVSVSSSLALAFLSWYFLHVQIFHAQRPEGMIEHYRNSGFSYATLWTLLALAIFHLHGFYTRTRGYAHQYKAYIVARAVTLLVVSVMFADVWLYHGELFPGGVALLSWIFLLASVGGSRAAKHLFLEWYRVEPIGAPTQPNRVLVVGGAGYLGSVLVPLLLRRGYRVRILDSLLFGDDALKSVKSDPSFELVRGDVREIEAVVQAMKGCDAVVDLAAIVGDPACEENPKLATEINRAATRMLIDVSRGYGIQRFLFASTCSVYGASEFLMDEHAQPAPISLYARTKVDSERLLLEARCADFHPTILRLATLFGWSPRPRFDLVVNLLTARAIRLGKVTVYNGEQWRPFMHVYDAARAFLACLEASNLDVVSGEIFNVGSFELNYRLSEIAEIISAIVPNVEVEHVENQDRRNYRVSFDKIHCRLGFVCERGVEAGIREMAGMICQSEVGDFSGEMFNNRAMVRLYAQSAEAQRSSIRTLESLARDHELVMAGNGS
jgi:nucleoside-diphosphate-sugar epimerase